MTVTAISPHPDDAEYGVWNTLAAHPGPRRIILVTHNPQRLQEAQNAADLINATLIPLHYPDTRTPEHASRIITDLETLLEGLILTPHPDDTHQDHRTTTQAVHSALRHSPHDVIYYRTPTTGNTFTPNAYTPVTPDSRALQQTAVNAHQTQIRRHYLHPDVINAHHHHYGHQLRQTGPVEPLQIHRIQLTHADPVTLAEQLLQATREANG